MLYNITLNMVYIVIITLNTISLAQAIHILHNLLFCANFVVSKESSDWYTVESLNTGHFAGTYGEVEY